MSRRPVSAGALATVITAGAYLPGLDRSLTYDAAETVGFFVLAPSPSEALTRQRSFNNHPLFSLLEHLIVRAVGHSDDWLLRLLPIGFAAVAVGLLVWAVHRAIGPLPAIAAGLTLATNPMYMELSRDVRGYSMLVFAAIVTTLLHLRLLRTRSTAATLGYVLAAVLGMMTHFLLGAVLAAHAVDVLWRRDVNRFWVRIWTVVGVLTLLSYRPMLHEFLDAGERRGRIFRASFPLDLLREVLGHEPFTVTIIGVIAFTGLLRVGAGRHPVPAFAVTTVAVAVAGWLLAPENLAPRFFLWLLPVVAVLIAFGASAHPRVIVPAVVVASATAVMGVLPDYTDSRNRYHDIAAIIDRAAESGEVVCVSDLSVPPTLAYTDRFEVRTDPGALATCDLVAIAEPALDRAYVESAQELFAHRMQLDARDPAVVFSQEPVQASVPRQAARPEG